MYLFVVLLQLYLYRQYEVPSRKRALAGLLVLVAGGVAILGIHYVYYAYFLVAGNRATAFGMLIYVLYVPVMLYVGNLIKRLTWRR